MKIPEEIHSTTELIYELRRHWQAASKWDSDFPHGELNQEYRDEIAYRLRSADRLLKAILSSKKSSFYSANCDCPHCSAVNKAVADLQATS